MSTDVEPGWERVVIRVMQEEVDRAGFYRTFENVQKMLPERGYTEIKLVRQAPSGDAIEFTFDLKNEL